MSWLLISILAQIILGSSAIFDKLFLKKGNINPFLYTFWLAVLGLFAIFLIPFGFRFLPLQIVLIAILSGALFTVAMFFYFLALHKGKASQDLPIIGGLTPVVTLILSYFLLDKFLNTWQIIGFFCLLLGSSFLFISEKKEDRLISFTLILISVISFGFSSVFSKLAFERSFLFLNNRELAFISSFVWIKIGWFFLALISVLFPLVRKKIFSFPNQNLSFKKFEFPEFLYFLNRFYAALGSILLYLAISLSHPALVEASAGLKYVIIFLLAMPILKENFRGKVFWFKIIATILIVIGLAWLYLFEYASSIPVDFDRNITWGVTFSQKFSQKLELNWKENYEAIVNDLGTKNIRLIAYWDLIERERGKFYFDDLDYQIKLAEASNTKVILAFGQKVPRWPECHYPPWINSLSHLERDKMLLVFIKTLVTRYKNNPSILYWQVENEPFLKFGECHKFEAELFDQEIALVKSLDPSHRVLTTDSGEVGSWVSAVRKGDIFGTTMYRKVHHDFLGYIDYNLPSGFFRLKEKIVRFWLNEYEKKFIVIELAAEPWLKKQLYETLPSEQFKFFDLNFFDDTIRYAKETGFNEYYLWGVEWWYWLGKKHGNWEFWEMGKLLNPHTFLQDIR